MRKIVTLALVAALCGALSACEGGEGTGGRDITREALSTPSGAVYEQENKST